MNPQRAVAGSINDIAFDPSLWIEDVAVINAHVITLDPATPSAEAVLVRNGRIAIVGSNDEVRASGDGVRIVDAQGRALVPGFLDTHVHIEWTAAGLHLMERFWGDAEPATIAEALDRLRTRATKTPPGQWVVGEGNIAGSVVEGRMPTTEEMDTVSREHPVVLVDMIHAHTANTLATAAMGYLTPADEAHMRWRTNGEHHCGGVVTRDGEGRPTGAYDLVMRLPKDLWSVEQLKDAIRKMAVHEFTEGGVTSASAMSLLSCNEYIAEQELHAAGELPLRIRATYMTPLAVSIEPILAAGIARGTGNDMFRIGAVKVVPDGPRADGGPIVLSEHDKESDNEQLAAAATSRPVFHYTQDQLAALIARIQMHGFPAQFHSLSEEGVELVTAAVEDVRRMGGVGLDLIHRVEHWAPSLELVERMRDAGVWFALIATHPDLDPTWAQTPDTPYRSYIERGAKPVLMSDRCGGYHAAVRPIHSITRACLSVTDGGEASVGNEVDFETALKMWTLWAAESTHQDGDRGSIAVGKLGDFALLSGDPAQLSAQELLDLRVDATILGGKVVYQSTD